MHNYTWGPQYVLGQADIDNEHHVFFDLLARIENEFDTTDDLVYEIKLLEELQLYARFHFQSEENIYEKLGLDGIENHRAVHRTLLNQLEQKSYDFMRNRDKDALINLLFRWLSEHTLGDDRAMLENL